MTSRMIPARLAFLPSALLVCMFAFSLVSCGVLGPAAKLGLMKLQFGCLPEGSMIDTPEGAVRVEDLKTGDQVTGYDGEPVEVQQVHQYQENAAQVRHLKVVFSGGREVQLSPQHRIGGIPARDLKVGDTVGGHAVEEIEPLGGVSRSFDLLTSDAGYQIKGVPVNSMIREMATAAGR